MAGGIPINRYKSQARGNWNKTDAVDLGDDIYEEELAAMEESARLLDIEEENDDDL